MRAYFIRNIYVILITTASTVSSVSLGITFGRSSTPKRGHFDGSCPTFSGHFGGLHFPTFIGCLYRRNVARNIVIGRS